MAIDVACACGARFRVKDQWAGRRAKCRKCGAVVTIPPPAAPERLRDLTDDDPLGLTGQPGAFDGLREMFSEEIPIAGGSASSGKAGCHAHACVGMRVGVYDHRRMAPLNRVQWGAARRVPCSRLRGHEGRGLRSPVDGTVEPSSTRRVATRPTGSTPAEWPGGRVARRR